ncbi:MAG: threonine--tRNA ligase [Coriobacteriales bacterium]|nr:threonine--tRNA ligase [Coriobacteriales bacterium]
MSKLSVELPDGSKKELEEGSCVGDVAAAIGSGLAKAALCGKIDGELVDLTATVHDGAKIEIITDRSEGALDIMRHSCAHVLAEAVQSLWPDVQIADGPSIEYGFYYDFALEHVINQEDFEKIEKRMAEIIKEKKPFVRAVVSHDEAKDIFKDQRFKLERIGDLDKDVEITTYTHGNFVDLCAGPHVCDAGKIGAFKLTSVAGAYWKGDSNNEMLQRVYGTAFFKKQDLKDYLFRMEEAAKRDHRKLGRELGIYMMDDAAGVGLPLYLPKGARIIRIMQEWLRKELYRRGYEEVITPHIYKSDVWKTSGHYDFYKENMYFFNINESGAADGDESVQEYGVKPMNCPGHVILYKNEIHSYRDLPVRYFEFGTVYRHELSGAVHGLLRARGFTQDDAHVFCTPEQVVDEVVAILDLAHDIMTEFGFEYNAEISTRPEKSIGSDDMWELATDSLRQALDIKSIDYEINEGDGAFYGPKIDIKVKDAIGRTWQCSTIQVDFNFPERFDMSYRTADNESARPFMLHRALFGSIERFLGVLIEHYAGALPLWLSPVQAVVVPIADRHLEAAENLAEKIRECGGRVEVYSHNEPMRVKIAKAQAQKIPYMLVLGDQEVANGQVAVRDRHEGDLGAMDVDDFCKIIKDAQV